MHYRTPAMGLGGLFFARVDEFLLVAGENARQVSEFSLDPSTTAEYAGIVFMAYQSLPIFLWQSPPKWHLF